MGWGEDKGGEIGYEHCITGARGHLYIYLHIDSSMGLPYSRTCIHALRNRYRYKRARRAPSSACAWLNVPLR